MATAQAKRDNPGTGQSPREQTEVHGGSVQVVEFVLGKEHFAIDLFDVKEVVEFTTITKLPNTPQYIKGIIDLRGEITTIVDLKQRLNILEESSVDETNKRIIVLDEKITKSKVGIMVDDVSSVSTFETNQVDHTTATGENEDTSILGIIKKQVHVKNKAINELIIWIDIKPLLNDIQM
ncbi:MAG: chemotaxis protein CheW [Methanoregula sp.]|nr:chemotaxis protein CheW [Methanoregula sp.]